MADTFSSKLGPSESTTLGRTFFNDLVGRLNGPEQVGNLQLRSSAGRAVVHPDDDALLPAGVTISDLTDWAGQAGPRAYVEWTLTGPGHLEDSQGDPTSSRETPAGSSVVWDWYSSSETTTSYYDSKETRAWNATPGGRDLPVEATVEAKAYVLTSEVTLDAVSTTADLETISGASDGDKVLVGGNRTVYELDTSTTSPGTGEYAYDPNQDGTNDGVWAPTTGPYYTEIGTAQQVIQIEPGEDPDYLPAPSLRLRPSAEVAHIDADGVAEIEIYDESRFSENASDVSRTVTAQVGSLSAGESVSVQSTAGPGDNLLNYDRDQKKLSVNVTATGEVTLTVDYEITEGGTTTTKTVTRHLLVKNLEPGPLGATFDPILPSVSVAPGNGNVELNLGETVEIVSATRTGSFGGDAAAEPLVQSGQTRQLARKIGVDRASDQALEGITESQVESLTKASTLIRSALQTRTDHGLGTFEIELRKPDVPRNKVVSTGQSEFRVVENLGTEGDRTTYRAIGIEGASQTYPDANAHLYGAADWYDLTIEAAYGNPNDTFDASLRESFVLNPGRQDSISIDLPVAEPGSFQDKWRIRYKVTSRWDNGATTEGEWSAPQTAERVPNSSLSIELTASSEEGGYWLEMPDDDYRFHGVVRWRSESGSNDVEEQHVLQSGQVGSQFVAEPPARLFGGAVLEVMGHFRARSGTCQESVQRAVTRRVEPTGLPVRDGTDKTDPDAFSVPSTNGVILQTKTSWALSADGVWVPIGGGTGPIGVEDVILLSGGSALGTTTKNSAVRWSGSLSYPASTDATIRFIFSGGVESVSLSNRRGRVNFNKEDQTADVRFSLSESDYGERVTVPLRVETANGKEMMLVYELSDSGTGTDNPPKVISVVVRQIDSDTEATISESSGGTAFTATTPATWSKVIATLITRNADEIKNVSGTPSGYDYDFYEEDRPPYITAILPLDSGMGSFQFDLENQDGTAQTFSLDVTD